MPKIVAWSIATFFATATGCLIWLTFLTTVGIRQAYQDFNQKIDGVIKLVDQRTGDVLIATNLTADKTDKRIASIQNDANHQLTELRIDITREIQPLISTATSTIGQFSALTQQISTVVPQVSPVLQAATKTVGDTDLLVQGVRPEAVGLLRDARLTSAELGRTSIYLRQATPQVLSKLDAIETDIKESTDSSVQASASTAAMMNNLRKATTPLPGWIRIPLSITGAVAPTAAGIVGALGATGVFQK